MTEAVTDQYRRWPYPAWERVTIPPATTIPAEVAAVDLGRPSGLPEAAEMLVAGCGTGREAALAAFRYPDARITAIDLSEASIAYAAERCREGPPARIHFRALDLNRVAELGSASTSSPAAEYSTTCPIPRRAGPRWPKCSNRAE